KRCLTTEQTATLGAVTGTQIKAAFHLENSAQAVTQIFGTLQAPTVAGLNAVNATDLLSLVAVAVNFLITDTTVQDTVQGNRRFCLSNASETSDKSSSEQSLFHVRNLRRFE